MRVVVRTEAVKFTSLREALRHRLEYEDTQVKELEQKLRKAYGEKSINKRSSLKEFIISTDKRLGDKEALELAEKFLEYVRKEIGITPYSQVFVHQKGRGTHIHILSVLRHRGRSIPFKPSQYKRCVRSFLEEVSPESLLEIERKKAQGKTIGAYPLWAIRISEMLLGKGRAKELVSLCRWAGVQKREFVSLLDGYKSDVESVRKRLKSKIEELRSKLELEVEKEFERQKAEVKERQISLNTSEGGKKRGRFRFGL